MLKKTIQTLTLILTFFKYKLGFCVWSHFPQPVTTLFNHLAQLLPCFFFSAFREEQDGQKVDEEQVAKAEVYMSILQTEQMSHQVDSCLQKNWSEDKAVNPEERTEELSEVFTLRDQLKQAEERASQVQREVWYSHQKFVPPVV